MSSRAELTFITNAMKLRNPQVCTMEIIPSISGTTAYCKII
ncbi:hypothetical protein T03_1741 [Trichinella britovi]|uniref:Uncharacterized protein n=1 Tax=Trichinella britovi TaxID=45882 RepID=A0A0V0ZGG4_TRIBR|nr:hypothetical protein T03_1741 [Trichinella britovi]